MTILLIPAHALGGRADASLPRPVAAFPIAGVGWASGQLTNLRLGTSGISLSDDLAFVRNGRAFGIYISPPQPVDGVFDLVAASFVQQTGGIDDLDLEARSSADGTGWSPWTAVPIDGQSVGLSGGRFVQFRVELSARDGDSPSLQALSFDLATSGTASTAVADASAPNPTVRLFATREGLTGTKTANGHTIVERDHFVSLPSRRVLNPDGAAGYQVRVSYKGRTIVAPIWDVGPWNTKDNFWDDTRDLFGDLSRFMPQAQAAWQNNYNAGRDQYNRWVSIPAAIDIADGTFLDDLAMRNSDWVDATLLWVNASSPPLADMPPVTGLKPEAKNSGPAADGRTWYFAEGSSKPDFDTWFLLLNPNPDPAKAYLNYMKPDGSVERQEVTLGANRRVSVFANQFLPGVEFSVRIDATRPIIVERSVYHGKDGHASAGVTSASQTWYLAEGSSQPPFDTMVLLQNPGSTPANVVLSFIREAGDPKEFSVTVPPTSRRTIHANDILPQTTFSMKIASDQPIVAERTVYLSSGGMHGTTAAPDTSTTWYLAEGSTQDGFDTWLLVLNPGANAASVDLTFLREGKPPLTQTLSVGAASRSAVNVRSILAGERFGAKIEADQPIVVERAMYFGGSSDGRGTGAHASMGAPDLAKTWYLAEGSTQSPYSEQILVANPGDAPTHLRVDFIRNDGGLGRREYDLDAASRLTIDVNAEVPNVQLSARVSGDRPIVVERSSYFNDGAGGTNSMGVAR